jgi:hypothetical protein
MRIILYLLIAVFVLSGLILSGRFLEVLFQGERVPVLQLLLALASFALASLCLRKVRPQ